MPRRAVSLLVVCSGLIMNRPLRGNTKVALIAHFERPPGPKLLRWITPVVAKVFRPAGLSLEWYAAREAVPANAARVLDVWFQGDCRPTRAHAMWRPVEEATPLAWVQSAHGHIIGNIMVDCAAAMGLTADAHNGIDRPQMLDLIYLRLLERALSHELLHVLLQSTAHGESDLTRPRMRVWDWERAARLTPAELDRLRQLYPPPVSLAQRRGKP